MNNPSCTLALRVDSEDLSSLNEQATSHSNTQPEDGSLARAFRRTVLWVSCQALGPAILLLSLGGALGQESVASHPENGSPLFGISERVPWTTSRLVGTPDPPSPYQAERVFPQLKFKDPVDLCLAPGLNRLFLAEQSGQIYSFPPEPAVSHPDLFFSLNKSVPGVNSLYGLIFHPGFQTNHFVYLCYVLKDGLADGSRVSRFVVNPGEPPSIDPASEKIILTFPSGGHNGGCLKFGPDGYLYISTGDSANPSPPDPLQTGQDISDLLSSILRIDVDHTDGQMAYRVPSDNPFVGRPGARPEVWAYGLRNPWRMSFDHDTGALWVADVGWELWEMVYKVERGGNYGWSIVEGPQSIHPDGLRGPTPILPPIKAHPHSEAASITGGFVYRGTRLKELAGAYIYGDWVTGKVWALRSEHGQLSSLAELVDTPFQIVCFAEDHAQELFLVDYGGGIYQLAPNSAPNATSSFPRKLSQTGLFTSTQDHTLAPGVLPFEVNAAAWTDNAVADRFVALPGSSQIQTGAKDVWLFQSKNEWRYPTNAVLGRTLSIERERGNRATLQRLETQLLHFDGRDWHAYTYRWNDRQNDGDLVDAAGDETTLEIKDSSAPGGRRQQLWRFHGRTECLRCHNPWVNVALAFTAPQLNRSLGYRSNYPLCGSSASNSTTALAPVVTANQLRSFSHLGYFDQLLDDRSKPKLGDPYDPEANQDERVRAWLGVNCGHCHREGAGGSVASHFDYETPLREMKVIGHRPSQGTFGLDQAHVITPGRPESSVLYYRVSSTGQGRMPLIGSRLVDNRAVRLLHDWIEQLSPDLSEDQPALDASRSPADQNQALATFWNSTSSQADRTAAVDHLLARPSGALALVSTINQRPQQTPLPPQLLRQAAAHPAFQVRDLFERFLPEDMRPKKLGLNPNPELILALHGDAAIGEKIFFHEGMVCVQCHKVGTQGREFGPDLSQIGRKHSRAQLLDQILFPSKVIEAPFVSYQVETKQGLAYTGFVVKRSPEEIVLKDSYLTVTHIPTTEIKLMQAQQLSVMPEGLLQSMTAQEAADLIEFLSKLQ